jgi:hypothetical protein
MDPHGHPGGGIGEPFISFSVPLSISAQFPFLPSLEFNNPRLLNPNIGAHHLCARENTHEMSAKKKLGKELSVEGPSQVTEAQALEATQATTQQQTSTEPQQATTKVKRPEETPDKQLQRSEDLKSHCSNHQAKRRCSP